MADAIVRTARCCCGQLIVEAKGEPRLNILCHCMDCKRRTGSAFGWSAYFREVELRGLWADYLPAESVSEGRRFCPDCGSTMYWRDARVPRHIGTPAGALEPPVDMPSASNQDGDRCAWLNLPGAVMRQ
jgi:hypothetical protein